MGNDERKGLKLFDPKRPVSKLISGKSAGIVEPPRDPTRLARQPQPNGLKALFDLTKEAIGYCTTIYLPALNASKSNDRRKRCSYRSCIYRTYMYGASVTPTGRCADKRHRQQLHKLPRITVKHQRLSAVVRGRMVKRVKADTGKRPDEAG